MIKCPICSCNIQTQSAAVAPLKAALYSICEQRHCRNCGTDFIQRTRYRNHEEAEIEYEIIVGPEKPCAHESFELTEEVLEAVDNDKVYMSGTGYCYDCDKTVSFNSVYDMVLKYRNFTV